MVQLTPVQQEAETALLRLLRRHMSGIHAILSLGRNLTSREIDERVQDLRRLKAAHPKAGFYFVGTVNLMMRELVKLKSDLMT